MTSAQDGDWQVVHDELERTRADFHHLLRSATKAELAMPTAGTRWNNEQLLFHMMFGYMIVLALLRLARVSGRLPRSPGRGYARLLNAASRPFHVINYLGPCAAVHVYGPRRMEAKFDRVIASLERRRSKETAPGLTRGMHFPVQWDPFFKDYMTLAELYRYPTQHYGFHRRQLTIKA